MDRGYVNLIENYGLQKNIHSMPLDAKKAGRPAFPCFMDCDYQSILSLSQSRKRPVAASISNSYSYFPYQASPS